MSRNFNEMLYLDKRIHIWVSLDDFQLQDWQYRLWAYSSPSHMVPQVELCICLLSVQGINAKCSTC